MASVLAPDGATVQLEGLKSPFQQVNFHLGVRLSARQPVQAFGVMLGRTLDAYRQLPLPPTYRVADVEDLQFRGNVLGIAHLVIATDVGIDKHLLWAGLETSSGLIRTAFHGTDRDLAMQALGLLQFEEKQGGIRILNEIDQTQRAMEASHMDRDWVSVTVSRLDAPANRSRIPTNQGTPTSGGTLYRPSERDISRILVTRTAIVTLRAVRDESGSLAIAPTEAMSSLSETLRAEWN